MVATQAHVILTSVTNTALATGQARKLKADTAEYVQA